MSVSKLDSISANICACKINVNVGVITQFSQMNAHESLLNWNQNNVHVFQPLLKSSSCYLNQTYLLFTDW